MITKLCITVLMIGVSLCLGFDLGHESGNKHRKILSATITELEHKIAMAE